VADPWRGGPSPRGNQPGSDGVSVFIDEMGGDLDLSRSAVSWAYLIGTITGALAMQAAGRLMDRRGLRVATLLFGAAFGPSSSAWPVWWAS
jgi:hypothetical protein